MQFILDGSYYEKRFTKQTISCLDARDSQAFAKWRGDGHCGDRQRAVPDAPGQRQDD